MTPFFILLVPVTFPWWGEGEGSDRPGRWASTVLAGREEGKRQAELGLCSTSQIYNNLLKSVDFAFSSHLILYVSHWFSLNIPLTCIDFVWWSLIFAHVHFFIDLYCCLFLIYWCCIVCRWFCVIFTDVCVFFNSVHTCFNVFHQISSCSTVFIQFHWLGIDLYWTFKVFCIASIHLYMFQFVVLNCIDVHLFSLILIICFNNCHWCV